MLLSLTSVLGQETDFVLKGGHVIDFQNGIDGVMDVAVRGNKIDEVAPDIPVREGERVVDVTGLYVVPGLIDMHAHHFPTISDYRFNDPLPDAFTFRNGVTTSVDAGSAGWKSFADFKEQVIDRSRTRVLVWLNIVGEGLKGRNTYEQDIYDMNAQVSAQTALAHRRHIVGFKVSHYQGDDWVPVVRAVDAGNKTSLPVMVDFGEHTPPLSLEKLFLEVLRPGDIFTHMYAYGPKQREVVVDEDGVVKPFVMESQKRGLIFDLGHGGGAFTWRQAIPSLRQGFKPDVISTDANKNSVNGAMQDILNVMSKMMAIGMSLNEVIAATTSRPAQVIGRTDLGNLSVGSEADIAVLRLREGDFGFMDVRKDRITGSHKLEAELTVRNGAIVWDLNGLSGNPHDN